MTTPPGVSGMTGRPFQDIPVSPLAEYLHGLPDINSSGQKGQ